MSNEAPRNAAEKTEENERLTELESMRAQLRFVKTSLIGGMERPKREAKTRAEISEQAYTEKSDTIIEQATQESRPMTPEERAGLGEAASARDEAKSFHAGLQEVHPINDLDQLIDGQGPLAEKLRSLGVDIDMATGKKEHLRTDDSAGFPGTIMNAIDSRRHELDVEINKLRLEVPGGLEEMVISAIQRTRALDQIIIGDLGQRLHMIEEGGEGALRKIYSVSIEPTVRDLADYPQPVIDGVIRRMVKLAQAGSNARIDPEEVASKLSAMTIKHT